MAILIAGALVFFARREVIRLTSGDIGALIVRRLTANTGIKLVSASSRTTFSYHAVVTFHAPRLIWQGRELLRAQSIALVFGYRTLLLHRGLPLLDLIVTGAQVTLPPGGAGVPVPDAATAAAIRRSLGEVAKFIRRVDVSGATIADSAGTALLREVNIDARRGFSAASPWHLRASWRHDAMGAVPAFTGGARLVLASQVTDQKAAVVAGSIWLAGMKLAEFAPANLRLAGELAADSTLNLDDTGAIHGAIRIRVAGLALGPPGNVPLTPAGEVTAAAAIEADSQRLQLSRIELGLAGRAPLTEGEVALSRPLGSDSMLTLNLSAHGIDFVTIGRLLENWRGLPEWLAQMRSSVKGGKLAVDRLDFSDKLAALRRLTPGDLGGRFKLDASISGLTLAPSAALPLPPTNNFDGEISYADGVAHLSHGHVRLGDTELHHISLGADLSQVSRVIAYHLSLRGELAPGGILPLARKFLPPAIRRRLATVKSVRGRIGADIAARGRILKLALGVPQQYRMSLSPAIVRFEVGAADTPYEIEGGTVVFTPQAVRIERLDVAPGGGRAMLSGELVRHVTGYSVRELDCALHGIEAQRWLPYLIDPHELAIHGPVGGNLIVSRARAGRGYRYSGVLTFGPGRINMDFLRSPVVLVNAGRATFTNRGVILAMPGSRFEGAQLDLSVKIPDLHHPAIQIDATAERLDLLAIKPIRMPWSPHVFQPSHDNTSYRGRLVAREATFGPVAMKDLSANFQRTTEGWGVEHLTAQALGGRLAMDLSGTRANDWVDIKTTLTNVDMSQLQALAGEHAPVITGRLTSHSSLRANTDGDFTQTLGGKLSIRARNGVLHRFTMLSRMLSLVDVSQWLNAKMPNPAVAGVPFNSITADFTGSNGVFRTDDFLLQGPVMEITAAGKIELPTKRLDIQVGMRPFQLLGTVFDKIPLIGTRLAASQNGLVAAYFNVRGPIADPSVVPAPITSISKILIRTLGIPVNLIAPNTIK